MVVIAGGGAAGIELAFAMRGRWAKFSALRVVVLNSGKELLAHEPAPCRGAVNAALAQRGIEVLHECKVSEVKETEFLLTDGRRVEFTHAIWATGAASHPLAGKLAESGIATTARGWVRVGPTLQSVSHPTIFAAGDCCTIEGLPDGRASPPKAGVYAVRAGLWRIDHG